MITKQPRPGWILAAGCALAFLAATVNAGFLIHLGTSVSHLTGDVSRVAMEGVTGRVAGALHLFVAAAGFVCGATAAGYFIHHPTIEVSRPYGRTISCIGVCLIVSQWFFVRHPVAAVGLGAFACGLQNALGTHYRGMVLRTTHVTGLLTDFGAHLGMKLRGREIARWKLVVPVAIVSSFFAGALFGSVLNVWSGTTFLLVPGCIYMLMGIAWTLVKRLVGAGPS